MTFKGQTVPEQPEWVFTHRGWIREDEMKGKVESMLGINHKGDLIDIPPSPRRMTLPEAEYALPIRQLRGFVDYRHADAVPASVVNAVQMAQNDLRMQAMREADREILSAITSANMEHFSVWISDVKASSATRRFRRRLAARRS